MAEQDGRRPRLLVVTRNLPPLLGGMEKLNQHMLQGLSGWADIAVVGPVGAKAHLPPAVEVREVPLRPLGKFLVRATLATFRLARDRRPDMILAGSGLTAPIAWAVARVRRIPVAAYVHGLDVVANHYVYRSVWVPILRRLDLLVANSRNTKRLAIARQMDPDRIAVVNPGTDLPPPDETARDHFRRRFSIGDRPVLLSVGRLTARKGIAEFVVNCMPSVLANYPDAMLVLIGDDAPDALFRTPCGGRESVMESARFVNVTSALMPLGPCDEVTLNAALQAADVHVFPVRECAGDVEGFGMVAIEAAAHGLPTVAFAIGGVPDAVIEGQTGSLVASADYSRFAQKTCDWLAKRDQHEERHKCRAAADKYSWDVFNKKMLSLLAPLAEPGRTCMAQPKRGAQ